MIIRDPAASLPRRELESSALSHEFGLLWLTIVVQRQAGVSKKTGEVRYRSHQTRYLVNCHIPGVVTLVTDRRIEDGAPLQYEVTRWACTCMDAQVQGKVRQCKHRCAVEEQGLLAGAVADGTRGA